VILHGFVAETLWILVKRNVPPTLGTVRTERSSGGKARWLGPCRPEFEPPWLRISGLSPGFALSRVEPQRECDVPVAYGTMVGPDDLTKDAIW